MHGWDQKTGGVFRCPSASVRTHPGRHLQCPARIAREGPAVPRPHEAAVGRNKIRKRLAFTPGAGIQINLVAVGIRHVPYRTTGIQKSSPRSGTCAVAFVVWQ